MLLCKSWSDSYPWPIYTVKYTISKYPLPFTTVTRQIIPITKLMNYFPFLQEQYKELKGVRDLWWMSRDSLHRAYCGDSFSSSELCVPSQKSHSCCRNDPVTYKGTNWGQLQISLIIHSSWWTLNMQLNYPCSRDSWESGNKQLTTENHAGIKVTSGQTLNRALMFNVKHMINCILFFY